MIDVTIELLEKYDITFESQYRIFVDDANPSFIRALKASSVAIHPRFNKLITALRTAVEKGDGSLDKDATSFDDCFDSFRLSMLFWD